MGLAEKLVEQRIREQRDKLREAVAEIEDHIREYLNDEIDAVQAMNGVRDVVNGLPSYIR